MKIINFGTEHLNNLKGGIVALFYETIKEKGWEFVTVIESKVIEVDKLNEKTIIRFGAPEGEWAGTGPGRTIQTKPYLFICSHAKNCSCTGSYILPISKMNIDQLLNSI